MRIRQLTFFSTENPECVNLKSLHLHYCIVQATRDNIGYRYTMSDWDKRGLLRDIEDPACLVVSTSDLVVIQDKFPKAKYHFLVAPLANIDSIFEVSKMHAKT